MPTTLFISAENPISTNFTPGIAAQAKDDGSGAVGGVFLKLMADYQKSEPQKKYYAKYSFRLLTADRYDLWVAAHPQNVDWACPLTIIIDGGKPESLKGLKQYSEAYGFPWPENYFCWTKAAPQSLSAGTHTVEVVVDAPRASGKDIYAAFLDEIVLTTDAQFAPTDNWPKGHPAGTKEKALSKTGGWAAGIQANMYPLQMSRTHEAVNESSTKEVERKLANRRPNTHSEPGIHRFGVHGMETPFVLASKAALCGPMFEMLSRVGVDSLRTAESCWHRLGDNFDHMTELDYQVQQASRYGMNFMLTMGYPDGEHSMARMVIAAAKPDSYGLYKTYLEKVIKRYAPHIQYTELANEVDAPSTWWKGGSTPEMYAQEQKMLFEATRKLAPKARVMAIASTYARDTSHNAAGEGRAWVKAALRAGVNAYTDGYTLHYTWPLAEQDFPRFFRDAVKPYGKPKPLVNSEEAAYGHPADIVKAFARDLFLYNMDAVYYYLGRDWYEAGNLIYSGLFDIDYRPKLRLLSFAATSDSMKGYQLVGMAQPEPNVEAYVLKSTDAKRPKYSIVMWRNGAPEALGPAYSIRYSVPAAKVKGLKSVVHAYNWRLDAVKVPGDGVSVGAEPVMAYCDQLPSWKLMSRDVFIRQIPAIQTRSKALVPGQ